MLFVLSLILGHCPHHEPKSFYCSSFIEPRNLNVNRIILAFMYTNDMNSVNMMRYLEYHYLMGVTDAIAFDNTCNNNSLFEPGSPLIPYVNAKRLQHNTLLRCKKIPTDLISSKFIGVDWASKDLDLKGAGGIIHTIMQKTESLPVGSLVIGLDVDEYLVSNRSLSDIRADMVRVGACVQFVYWRFFGASGYVCQPTGPIIKHFNHRAPTEAELHAIYPKELANKIIYQLALDDKIYDRNSLYRYGKPLMIKSPNIYCTTHTCKVRNSCKRNIMYSSQGVYIAHFYTQSAEQWNNKRRRGRTSGQLSASSGIPRIYDAMYDPSISERVDDLISNIGEIRRRTCLRQLFARNDEKTQRLRHEVIKPTKILRRRKRQLPKLTCKVTGDESIRVAIAFYGVSRGIRNTLPSIRKNLLEIVPGSDIFIHTLSVIGNIIENDRFPGIYSGSSQNGTGDAMLLQPCRYEIETQSEVDVKLDITERSNDSFVNSDCYSSKCPATYKVNTFKNIFRQKYSIWKVANLIHEYETHRVEFLYTHVILSRMDVRYDSPLVWNPLDSGIRVANSHHWMGINDRFAFGDRKSMLKFMSIQFEELQRTGVLNIETESKFVWSVMNTETHLCKLISKKMPTTRISVSPICITRLRNNGIPHFLDFALTPDFPNQCHQAVGISLVADKTEIENNQLLFCPIIKNMNIPAKHAIVRNLQSRTPNWQSVAPWQYNKIIPKPGTFIKKKY